MPDGRYELYFNLYFDRKKLIHLPKTEDQQHFFENLCKDTWKHWEDKVFNLEKDTSFKRACPSSYAMEHKIFNSYAEEYKQIYKKYFIRNSVNFLLS